jgi:hypothetical protein
MVSGIDITLTNAADKVDTVIVEPVKVEYNTVEACNVECITALFIKELVADSVEPDMVE